MALFCNDVSHWLGANIIVNEILWNLMTLQLLMYTHVILTFKHLGIFFQNVVLLSNIVPDNSNMSVWNWSNTMNIYLVSNVGVLMAWCFSTRVSVAAVLCTHPWVIFPLFMGWVTMTVTWNEWHGTSVTFHIHCQCDLPDSYLRTQINNLMPCWLLAYRWSWVSMALQWCHMSIMA